MTEFWNSLLTEKSWDLLLRLNKEFKFILIGGWAAYLFTDLHKSKDIDIAVSLKVLDYLKKNYNVKKNDNLKKYEIKFEEIDLDIYVPYYSKLVVPVSELKDFSVSIKGFSVVRPEVLLILKQDAERDREFSIKGEKDRIDIIALLCYSEIDFKVYKELIKKYNCGDFLKRLVTIINRFNDVKYLDLNLRELRLKKKEILKKLKFI